MSEAKKQVREQTIDTALDLIKGDRANEYDTKDDASGNFRRIAALWSVIVGVEVTPVQVALCLIQLKIARLVVKPSHKDSWVDIVGYGGLGSEVAAVMDNEKSIEDIFKGTKYEGGVR